jgi:hypothetical protein
MIRVLSSTAARISSLALPFSVARTNRLKLHTEIAALFLEKRTKYMHTCSALKTHGYVVLRPSVDINQRSLLTRPTALESIGL